MPRFSPATEAALLAAGWFEGRAVPDEQMNDWLIINWNSHPLAPLGYTQITPTAWRVLKEFGGLSIERANHGNQPTYPFVFNPLLVPDYDDYAGGLNRYVWEIGATLFPLGTVEHNIKSRWSDTKHHAIAICDDGRVFMLDRQCRFLGNSIEEALEKIVNGEIDEHFGAPHDLEKMERIGSEISSIYSRILNREKQLMQGQWPDQSAPLSQANRGVFFEITDWDAEAALVARAFAITENCRFFGPYKEKWLYPKECLPPSDFKEIPLVGELSLRVIYKPNYRTFQLVDSNRNVTVSARVSWNGEVEARVYRNYEVIAQNESAYADAPLLARGLFNLGLLTPEAEKQLKLNLTYHEKLEWQLEFETSA